MDDEYTYLARIQEIMDGHWLSGSPYFFEYKDAATIIPPIGEYAYALPSMALHVPLAVLITPAKAIFSGLLFLLVFFFVTSFFSEASEGYRRLLGVTSGWWVVFGYELMSDPSLLWKGFTGATGGLSVSIWTRPVNPIIRALLLFGILIILLRLWRFRGGRFSIACVGILTGLSFFYFFSWAIIMAIIASLGIVAVFFHDRKRLCVMATVFIVAVICTIPVAYPVVIGLLSFGDGLAAKNGMMITHVPLLNKILVAAALGFLGTSFWKRRKDGSWRFFSGDLWQWSLAILLACGAVFSQQLITGRTVWPYHFVQYTKPLLGLFGLLVSAGLLRERHPRLLSIAFVLLSVASLLAGMVMTISSRIAPLEFKNRQAYAPLFSWLNTQAEKDCVVLVHGEEHRLASQISAFTHCNTYAAPYVFSGIPVERIKHNIYIALLLDGVTSESVVDYLASHPSFARSNLFEDWSVIFSQNNEDPWLKKKNEELASGYRDFLQTPPDQAIKKYRADYLATEQPLDPARFSTLGLKRFIRQMGPVFLYAFHD